MRGNRTGIFVKANLRAKIVSEDVNDNIAYVKCALTVGRILYGTIIVTVYRARWTLILCVAKLIA